MKKILLCIALMLSGILGLSFVSQAYNLVDLPSTNGGNVTYRGTSTVVQIPDVYELQGTEFRGAWVSLFVGDMPSYYDEESWKKEVATTIEVFKYYNLNAMIFHVRTHNNALYDSELNPIAKWFTNANFKEFDPLTYLIDECHKAGIEFHAWMNPYRISTLTSDINTAVSEGQYLGEKVPSANPARFAGNLIAGSGGVILNPGLPKVRDFIVDTCMEVIEKYDVDAIHFDDYFYISGAQDDDTYAKYNPKKLGKADWRREQVNLFIEQLHDEMTAYNKANGRAVQLGISPSGIYKNGNGSIESGSNTAGFAHYGDYLYSDTYKWAKEGWIDYLLPQSYWAFEHPSAGYADVMSWWNKAFEGLDCLLYSGIGVYMADGNNYSWKTNKQELTNQLKYLTSLENVDGYSVYKYSYMKDSYRGGMNVSAQQIRNAYKAGCFADVALVPEIETMEPIVLEAVEDLVVNGNTLTWKHNKDAKAYAIYRNEKTRSYDNALLVAIIGATTDVVTWTDDVDGEYDYDVRPISKTNTLGDTKQLHTVIFQDGEGNILSEQKVANGSSAITPEDPVKEGYKFIGWDQDFTNITEDLVIKALFEKEQSDESDKPTEEEKPVTPEKPENPEEILPGPSEEKGCKKDLLLVVISLISVVTISTILLKKDR